MATTMVRGAQGDEAGQSKAARLRTTTTSGSDITSNSGETVDKDPVSHVGDEIVFRPRFMQSGELYAFRFLGERFWVMKRPDEALEVFYLPSSSVA